MSPRRLASRRAERESLTRRGELGNLGAGVNAVAKSGWMLVWQCVSPYLARGGKPLKETRMKNELQTLPPRTGTDFVDQPHAFDPWRSGSSSRA